MSKLRALDVLNVIAATSAEPVRDYVSAELVATELSESWDDSFTHST